jgi:hypothetical protein
MRNYTYWISAMHKTGLLTCSMTRSCKIKTVQDIKGIQNYLENEYKVEKVGLINFILLSR